MNEICTVLRADTEYESKAYWSNKHGWVDISNADVFSEEEKNDLNLPLESKWRLLDTWEKVDEMEWHRLLTDNTEYMKVVWDDELQEPSWVTTHGYFFMHNGTPCYECWDAEILGNTHEAKEEAIKICLERIEEQEE